MNAILSLVLLAAPPAVPWMAPPTFAPAFIHKACKKPAQRVVTLAPSATEIVFALGQGARVVGVSRFDDYPPAVKALPRVGGFLDPNLEAIVALRPDLVIAAPNASIRPSLERLDGLGIPVLVVPGNGFSDLFYGLDAIAACLDAEPAAARLSKDLAAAVDALRAHPPPRRRVAVAYDRNPLILAGPGSFADTLLNLLGAENVVKLKSEYPAYSKEQLVLDAPELIIDGSEVHAAETSSTADPLVRLEGPRALFWQKLGSLPAVKHRELWALEGTELLRPGPRIVRGMQRLAEILAQAQSGPKDKSK
ncbi:MAG: helical backbone metal receptor [Myxococcota bacterium]